MAITSQNLNGNGDVDYVFTFPSIKIEDVKVEVNGSQKTVTTDYEINDYSTESGGKVNFVTSVGSPLISTDTIRIFRDTDVDSVRLTYQAGSSIKATQLNDNNKQLLYFLQEVENRNEQMTFIGSEPPADPRLGAIWFQPELGRLFVYYLDPDGDSYWIECNPAFTSGDLSNINLTNLTDTNIAANADIQGSKLLNDSISLTKLSSGSLPLDISVQTNNIVNGTIVNDDVNASAAIQASKLSYTNPATGGVSRNLATKLNDIINVKDFNAKGDGTTDDKAAIQAAIDAVPSGGGIVYFPAGKYLISGKLILSKDQNCIRLEGCGTDTGANDEGSILYQSDRANHAFIQLDGCDNITIRHLLFRGGTFWNSGTQTDAISDGTYKGSTGGTGAITAYRDANGGGGHLFEDLRFLGIVKCISLHGVGQSVIRNINASQVPVGNVFDGQVIILDQHSSGGTIYNIHQARLENIIIDASYYPPSDSARNTSVRGISLHNEVNTVFISNTSIIRALSGVYTDSSWKGDFLYFNNVEAERAVENGFQLAADSSAAVGPFVEMVNCFACTCEQSGVRVFDNFNGVLNISNINARDNNDHGILLECKPANQVSISDPIIGGNNRNNSGSTNGITIINEVHNVSIIGGKCGGDTKDLAGQGNQAYGIACEGDNHKNMRFIGVNCTGNVTGGIGWTSSNTNVAAASYNFIKYCPGFGTNNGQTSFPDNS